MNNKPLNRSMSQARWLILAAIFSLAAFLLVPKAQAAIALLDGSPVAITHYNPGTTAINTASFTASAGASVMVVILETRNGSSYTPEPSTLTWNNKTLTQDVQSGANASTYRSMAIYHLNNPGAGTSAITGTYSKSSSDYWVTVYTLSGVDTTVLPLASQANTGTSTTATSLSFTVNSVPANAWAAVGFVAQSTITSITGTGGTTTTAVDNSNSTYAYGGDISGLTPAGTITFSAAFGSSKAVFAAVVFSPARAAAWTGASSVAWDTATGNWSVTPVGGSAASGAYNDGDTVTFDDTASKNFAVTLAATVWPASTTVNNTVNAYSISGAGAIGGSGGLTKTGGNTLTLSTSAGNTYTGPTLVYGGTLLEDFTGLGSTANLISSSSALTLGGGTLSIKNKGSGYTAAQTFAATTTLNGFIGSGITLNANGGASTTPTLTLGSTWNRSNNSLLNINTVNGGTISSSLSAQTLGYATVTDATASGFASASGTAIARLTGQTALPASGTSASTDYLINYATSATYPTANFSVNTLTMDSTAGGFSCAFGSGTTMTLTRLGLLMLGGNNITISSGAMGAAGSETIIHTMGSGSLTINGTVGSSTGSLTKNGSGTLNLGGVNTYSGMTVINQGILQVTGSGQLGSGSYAGNIINGGTFTYGSSVNQTLSGVISGAGSVTEAGAGRLTLANANTYTGTTTISAGVVNVGYAETAGTSGPLGNQSALAAGTINFGGGTLQYSSANHNDYSGRFNSTGSQPISIDVNGQGVTLATALAAGDSLTLADTAGGGVLTLSLAETYSGNTIINGGTLNLTGSIVNSAVTVNGGLLGGTGTVNGAVTVNTGGGIAPGVSGTGILNLGSSLSLAANSTNVFGFTSATAYARAVVAGALTVTDTTVFTLNTAGGTVPWTGLGTYNLIQCGSLIGGSLDGTWTTASGSNPHIANPQPNLTYTFGTTTSGGYTYLTLTINSSYNYDIWATGVTSGNWSATSSWTGNNSPVAVPSQAGDSATFGSDTVAYGVNLDMAETVGSINMNNPNSTAITSAGVPLTVDNAGYPSLIAVTAGSGNVIQPALTLDNNLNLTVGSGDQLTISGSINNKQGGISVLANNGAGTTVLSAANTYGPAAGTVGTTLSGGGILQVGNSGSLGAGDVTVTANSTLQAGGTGLSLANNLIVSSGVNATVDNNANNLTLGGVISGGNLRAIGTGGTTLSGVNTYSGATTISGGTLTIGGAGQLGSGSYAGSITDNGSFVMNSTANQALSGVISGGGSLTQSGSGKTTLSVTETFTGATTVNGGTLALSGPNNASSTLSSSSGLIINNGGTVQVNSDNALAGNAGTLGTLPVTINAGGTLTDLGTADSGAGATTHIRGVLTLAGGTLAGAGAGSTQNGIWDLDDGVVVSGGTTTSTISSIDVVPSEATTTTFNVANVTSGGIDLNITGTLIHASGQPDTGITKSGAGNMVLSGVNTYTGATTISGGTLTIGGAGQLGSGTYAGNIADNGALVYNSSAAQTLSGVISGTGNLTQSGSGNLTLSGVNTYSGTTTIGTGGTLTLGNSLALQDSTLNYSSGTLSFGSLTAATLGSLTGSSDLTIPSTVTLTIGNNNAGGTYSGNLSGGGALTIMGTGALTFNNLTYTGPTTNAANTTTTISGGTFGSSTSSLIVGTTGTLTLNGTASVTAGSAQVAPVGGETGGSMNISGGASAIFTTTTIGGTGNTGGHLNINTSGTVALGALIDYKDNQGALSTSRGLIINSGTVTANSVIIQNAGNGANLNITGGSFTIGNSSTTGGFIIADYNSGNGNGGYLSMSGGTLTYLGTDGLLAGNSAGTVAPLAISGGTANLTGITLDSAAAAISSSLTLSGGATLYLGNVGLVIGSGDTASPAISLGSATVGAIAAWTSSAPITLASGGNTIFQPADSSNNPHNIALNGVVSGSGALTVNGSGNLTLSGVNTYSGATTISGGTLTIGGAGQLGSGSYAGAITDNGSFVMNSTANQTLSGVISGGGSLTQSGSGKTTLSVTETFTGATTVNGGTLALSGSGSLTSPTITVASGATFDVSAVTGGSYALNGSGTLALNIGKTGSTLTQSQVAAGAQNLTYGGALTVAASGSGTLASGDSFPLVTKSSGNLSGWFSSVTLPTLASGLSWDTNDLAMSGVLDVYSFSTTPLTLSTLASKSATIPASKLANHALSSKAAGAGAYPKGWTATLASSPSLGTASFDGSGNLIYTAGAALGADSFTVTFFDGHGSQTMAVDVTVSAANTGPSLTVQDNGSGYGTFTASGIPGTTYIVQLSTDMSTWTDYDTTTASSNGLIDYVDQTSISNHGGTVFYRLKQQ